MARFGPNFGAPSLERIPVRVHKILRRPNQPTARLVGAATTIEERDTMLAEANNGRRALQSREYTSGGVTVYAIYAA